MNENLQGFHVSRLARDRYQFRDFLLNYWGKAAIPNFQAARSFANQINQKRDLQQTLLPSQIHAVALIQGITQHLFRLYCESHPQVLSNALATLEAQLGNDVEGTLRRFLDLFPPHQVYWRITDIPGHLAASHENRSNRETTLEELVLLWLANANPAYSPFFEFFGDDQLKRQTAYNQVTTQLKSFFAGTAQNDPGNAQFPGGVSILDILLEPMRASPDSLEGQLRYLIGRWGSVISEYVYMLLTAMDILVEENRAIPGPGGPPGRGEAPVLSFERTEFESENFTPDRDWMPNLVMIAKNAYVWLDQLSRKYQRELTRLDQIPDEELDQLARWGITGLWLIGLWERSTASQRIKQMTGNPDAVASAYSLYDYQIAGRLGGEAACQDLRARAWKRGIRLASDMVPNHVGIDGRWVIEHPDWFLSLNYSPYPSYSFNGADLSPDDRVGIFLEDHYYDRSDAAVVFKRVDRQYGDVRYIYHGNDGTSMPWNDTAQLNYLNPDLREAMVQTILHVARQFPIIRFDAAMTLVKKHIQRLWFPEPGSGGAIPSRAEHGMTRAQFDELMPVEFWREVVDRAAVEAPDTLLLAEAFWLLEGYFVRTLGMHRVYNSAFMNMMRDEENAKYRTVMKNTIEFDPEVLRRYVNFLNNPDEKTAVEQFGKDDKYFGVCVLLVTMPGLPMFGHGQIEGFAEKYGMEYYRAYWDEQPDGYLVQRHEREIFPLCRRRYLFAGVDNFLLYDFYTTDGTVDENVYAYSNRVGDERAVVLYNNAYANTRGWIRMSAAFSVKVDDAGTRQLVQRTLGDGLALQADDNLYVIFRDHKSGLEHIHSSREFADKGLYAELNAYQYTVLLDFREVEDNANFQYRELAGYLMGRGVPSIDDALREVMVEPVRAPFRELVNAAMFQRLHEARTTPDDTLLDDVEEQMARLMEAVEVFNNKLETPPPNPLPVHGEGEEDRVTGRSDSNSAQPDGEPTSDAVDELESLDKLEDEVEEIDEAVASPITGKLQLLLRFQDAPEEIDADEEAEAVVNGVDREEAPELLGGMFSWLVVSALGDAEQSRSWIDEWLLGRVIAAALREWGVNYDKAGQTLTAVKLATGQQDAFLGDLTASELLDALLRDSDAQQLLNINHFEGILWFNQEGFDTLLQWLAALVQFSDSEAAIQHREFAVKQLQRAAALSGYQVEKLRSYLRILEGHKRPTPEKP